MIASSCPARNFAWPNLWSRMSRAAASTRDRFVATHECVAEHVHDVQGCRRPHGAAPHVTL